MRTLPLDQVKIQSPQGAETRAKHCGSLLIARWSLKYLHPIVTLEPYASKNFTDTLENFINV